MFDHPTLVFPGPARFPLQTADLFLSKASAEALRQTEAVTQGLRSTAQAHPRPTMT